MGRFYSYDEIVARELTPSGDIQWLAAQIAQSPPFAAGTAVLCGSVAWGEPTWRSDIDVAHFSTIEHPHIEEAINDVLARYRERTEDRYIVPRVDVIAIGAESKGLVKKKASVSTSTISAGGLTTRETTTDLFVETALRFADHIGSISTLKGDPWAAFLGRYLSSVDRSVSTLRQAIRSYVENVTAAWSKQPLHRFNLGHEGRFGDAQLELIAKSENYPIHLMRRLLAERGQYPRPDRAADVIQAFSGLSDSWAQDLVVKLQPFFSIGQAYDELVAACKRPDQPLTASEYYDQLRTLFVDLPFPRIQTAVWQYLES